MMPNQLIKDLRHWCPAQIFHYFKDNDRDDEYPFREEKVHEIVNYDVK